MRSIVRAGLEILMAGPSPSFNLAGNEIRMYTVYRTYTAYKIYKAYALSKVVDFFSTILMFGSATVAPALGNAKTTTSGQAHLQCHVGCYIRPYRIDCCLGPLPQRSALRSTPQTSVTPQCQRRAGYLQMRFDLRASRAGPDLIMYCTAPSPPKFGPLHSEDQLYNISPPLLPLPCLGVQMACLIVHKGASLLIRVKEMQFF